MKSQSKQRDTLALASSLLDTAKPENSQAGKKRIFVTDLTLVKGTAVYEVVNGET